MAVTKGGIPTQFPSQAVSDLEKMTPEYGLSVARAIQQEWFNKDSNYGLYYQT